MAYIAKTDGTFADIALPVSLETAQEIVGGYVERVIPRHTPGVVFLCDEEGLLKGKPINARGCVLYGSSNPIVGDIIVFESITEAVTAGWVDKEEL